jgi:UDP-glucose 4-epimerase
MRYLVTGGSGFIGSHLVEALITRGDRVLVLDDHSTGSIDNLATMHRADAISLIHGSVCDQLLVEECCQQVDRVVHLAAAVGVKRILDRQVNSIITNLHGTETVLRAAHAYGRLPVLYASTSEVYGKQAHTPFREDDDSVLGASSLHRWSYACSKLMDEFLALAYHRERTLPITIARLFNVTGPRQSPHYGMVLPRFCASALAGKPLEVHDDGAQSRCFLHVHDCVAAILALIDCPAAVGQVVNVGAVQEVSILELAMRVIRLAKSASTISHVAYAQAYPQGGFEDLRRRVPSVERLQALTGWHQSLDLDATILDCLAWQRTRPGSGRYSTARRSER